jgi:hypothetical protein
MPDTATAPTMTPAQLRAAGTRILGFYLGGGGAKVDAMADAAHFLTMDATGKYVAAGPIAAPDGNEPAPALAFASEPGTGFYRGASGLIAVSANGVSNVYFASGKVGVGTYVPIVPVHIQAPDQGQSRLRIHNTAVGGRAFDLVAGIHGASQGDFSIYDATNAGTLFAFGVNYFRAGGDNSVTCGAASNRWSVVYAVTGAINTCDVRFKLFRIGRDTTLAEHAASLELFDAFGFYQFIEQIEAKGTDGARWHYGPAAQEVWAIWASHGLVDALGVDGRPVEGTIPPAFLCWDAIDEEREAIMEGWRPSSVLGPDNLPIMVRCEEGEEATEMRPTGETRVVREAGHIFGVRIDQLQSLMLAALNKERKDHAGRIAAQEARIAALEAAA